MADESIPPAVRTILTERIESAGQLEALLYLHANPDRAYAASQVAAELRLDPQGADAQLLALSRRGLIERSAPSPNLVLYQGRAVSDELRLAVEELGRTYAQRRVAVISFIYSKPPDKLRTFADAFKLRGEDPPRGPGN